MKEVLPLHVSEVNVWTSENILFLHWLYNSMTLIDIKLKRKQNKKE